MHHEEARIPAPVRRPGPRPAGRAGGGTPGTADTPAANTDTPAAPTQTGSLEGTTLKVGASPAPHAEILGVVKELLAEEGITLEIVEFTDYIQPNTAVENGSIDANYFQHITYLNNFNTENDTHLVSVADVHYEPFGIYAGKTASLEELQDGAQIGVPNDPTNGGRALLLLQEQGLITLKEDVGLEPTKLDIAENPTTMRSWRWRPPSSPAPWAAWTLPSSTATTPSRPI